MAPTGARVLALDIGGTKLTTGIGHADGEITRQAVVPTVASDGAVAVLERALALAHRCYDAELAAGGRVAAVGVSTMGLTHATHVELAPNVPGWHDLRVPEALESSFPDHQVVVGNDVQVAARAEMTWGSLRDVDHGLYINLGTGIAAGIIVNGRLVEGAHGAPGEVGYTLLHARSDEDRIAPEGAAPFEEFYGGAGVARRLAGTELPATVAEIIAREDDDPSARAFLNELWTGIAVLAANLCIALDPRVLVIGGGYVRSGSRLLARVREVVERAAPFPPTVALAQFGADASLRGAAAAALATVSTTS